jgi:predicted AAA+ superfamily ATPase
MIGRKTEQNTLLNCWHSKESEFVVLYGRRRVGKTYLVNQTFEDKFFFRFTGSMEYTTRETIEAFRLALTRYGAKSLSPKKDWMNCFEDLRTLIESDADKENKKVIFIDELPWMDKPRSRFLPAFEHFYNSWASSRRDILLIVCGSATSWIIKNLFESVGSAFNRVTKRLKLMPFSLAECIEFYQSRNIHMDDREVLESYMIFGGIPYYLNQLERNQSFLENVDRLCFGEEPYLKNELRELIATMFTDSDAYLQIIQQLGKKKMGLTRLEIANSIKQDDGGSLNRILQNMENCDLIRSYDPFGGKKQGQLYQLYDPFILFGNEFMRKKNRDSAFWRIYSASPAHNAWSGYAFEILCLHHLPQIKQALGISGVITRTCSWKSKSKENGAQIDLVIDRNDNVVDLCEMKYVIGEFRITDSYRLQLENKISVFMQETKTKKAPHLVMVTTYGVEKIHTHGIVSNQITMRNLFQT